MKFDRQGFGRFLTLAAIIVSGGNAQAQEVVKGEQINYVTGDPATSPAELEATVAAPDNHKILLENDHVRVLEVTLAPGEVEPLHFHRWPSVLHILQADQWIDRDAEGKEIFDSREVPTVQYPLTMWKGPEAPHSPVNLSDSVEVRLTRVEIKTSLEPSARTLGYSLFPSERTLTHAEDGVVLPDGRLLVGNLVCPGVTDTPLHREIKGNLGAEAFEAVKEGIHQRRFGDPVEIARAIAFLASDEASFITGTTLTADGGFHLTL